MKSKKLIILKLTVLFLLIHCINLIANTSNTSYSDSVYVDKKGNVVWIMPKNYYYIVTEGLQKEKYQRELLVNFEKSIKTYDLQINNYQKSLNNKDKIIKTNENYNNFLQNKIKQDSTFFISKINNDSKTIKRLNTFKTVSIIESIVLVFIIIFK